MKAYYVDGGGSYFVCLANNRLEAKREGIEEFGRGGVHDLREATKPEAVAYYKCRFGIRVCDKGMESMTFTELSDRYEA